MNKGLKTVVGVLAVLGMAGGANASLSLFQSFTGDVGMSTAGCGSTTQSCTLTANVPTGATVLGVYLYSSMFNFSTPVSLPGGTLAMTSGPTTSYAPMTSLGQNIRPSPFLVTQAWRNDLTSVFASAMTGGGSFTFTATETSRNQDGEALVVVYDLGGANINTVFVFDGFSASTGDAFGFNVAPITATSQAEMRLGIGFSFDGTDPSNPNGTAQVSRIGVNGALGNLTNVAGHCDDARDTSCADGNLITVGDDNDAFAPLNPTVGQDHERYNLLQLLALGATTINVATLNASQDDNIFLAAFQFSGRATVIPEPASLALLAIGLAGLGFSRRKK